MVKLATARESRAYGPRRARNRWEYINAGIYVFGTFFLVGGFAAQFSERDAKSGLVVLLIGTGIVAVVNAHDLAAHIAGVDYCLALVEFDAQLGLVEFAVPLVHLVGTILAFIAMLFLFIQRVRGFNYMLERHALNMLIAGPVFWVLGTIHDACQIYERADGHVQILQKGVQIPFLMGSLLFLVGGIFNRHDIYGSIHHAFKIMSRNWIWLCIFGSLLFLVGGLLNVVKVFKMQQMDGVRLEKLRGGALERLNQEREGQVPLILEDNHRRKQREVPALSQDREANAPLIMEDNRRRNPREESRPVSIPTPYKDVLLGTKS